MYKKINLKFKRLFLVFLTKEKKHLPLLCVTAWILIIFSNMCLHSVKLHAVVVQSHEDDVDHDAEGDEELREGVEHNDGEYLQKYKRR